ncbi:LysR substrate-binding domain-containing protein [Salinispirillum marinum]|uniref:LysR substrate-binding domain-containing protein n=2 Tax=Saccharospirillaceae TaxID=255527 RepID=A0ABV8BD46_9GAMM
MERLNFRHLHYFWMVVKEGSMARASEQLALAPQTLSGQIATFEQTIGRRLFHRRGRQLQLTDHGHQVFRYADDMFKTADQLSEFLADADTKPMARLCVGISASIHKLLAYRTIAPVLESHAGIQLKCHTGGPQDLLKGLRRRELHVVITDWLPVAEPDFKWQVYNLGATPISLFAEEVLAQRLMPGFPESLDEQPFLASTLDAPYHHALMEWFRAQRIRLREVAEIDDSALLKVFGHAGLGVFAAPSVIAEEVCRQYRVRAVGEVAAVQDQLYAITHAGALHHPGVETICQQQIS